VLETSEKKKEVKNKEEGGDLRPEEGKWMSEVRRQTRAII
jgi:hypothetical protein